MKILVLRTVHVAAKHTRGFVNIIVQIIPQSLVTAK